MQTEAIAENIPSPIKFHLNHYFKSLNSKTWWVIFLIGFAYASMVGVSKLFILSSVLLITGMRSYSRSSEKYRKLTADKNRIAPIVGYKARTYHIGMFFLKLPRHIILGMLAGFVTMMVFGGIFNNISTDASATLGMAALILFPAWISYRSSSEDLKKINAAYIEMPAQIAAVLEKVDYFYLGIGVDVANKMLATNSIDRKYRISEPFKFSLDKVINYQAFSPGYTVISGTGLNSARQAQTEAQNLSTQIKSKNETGLYIDLDDVNRPRVFVEMTFDHAESWVLLLNKLRNGRLEKQSTALLYPCQYH
jgi:hypothetical protein